MRVALVAATVASKPVRVRQDNLQKVKGIGATREQRIYELGIFTYQQLIDADAARLAASLGSMVSRSVVRGWQKQAKGLA